MLTVGSLFSGIGGFDLGLERAGMRVIWQSEIDPYACAVLRKHWPAVPNLGDIRGITAATVADACGERRQQIASGAHGDEASNEGRAAQYNHKPSGDGQGHADILCGGFPCQDISNAGKRAGIDGERSGLWAEFARVIGELRPRYVIVENVAALLGRGIERVLGDLAALGFDAEWHCIPASAVGAPHRRDRVWIIAYARSEQHEGGCAANERAPAAGLHANVADASEPRLEGWADPVRPQGERRGYAGHIGAALGGDGRNAQWCVEPDVGRVAHGIPRRVDRLRCLGNAIVPQIAEIIGRAIVSAELKEAA